MAVWGKSWNAPSVVPADYPADPNAQDMNSNSETGETDYSVFVIPQAGNGVYLGAGVHLAFMVDGPVSAEPEESSNRPNVLVTVWVWIGDRWLAWYTDRPAIQGTVLLLEVPGLARVYPQVTAANNNPTALSVGFVTKST